MNKLENYQKTAVEKIYEFFCSDKRKAKIYLSTGLGKTDVLISAIQKILSNKYNGSLAVLTNSRLEVETYKLALSKANVNVTIPHGIKEFTNHNLLIAAYYDVIKNISDLKSYDLVICDNAQFLKYEIKFEDFIDSDVKFLGLLSNIEADDSLFYNSDCLFSYMIKDAVNDGYVVNIKEVEFIQQFLIKLLDYRGYKSVSNNVKMSYNNKTKMFIDIVAEYEKETLIIDVKYYRGLYNSKEIIDNAVQQVIKYKEEILKCNENKSFTFIIVLSCEIDEKMKNDIYKKSNIIIWDISNLLYLCEDNKELIQLLSRYIPYSILNLVPQKPLDIGISAKTALHKENDSLSHILIQRLTDCKSGKENNADKDYENICTQIIKFLFETEFYRISEQHNTNDEMFRMDLLCSLKGTTEFWKFLISFYKTKFVVFEYKNHSDYISQNLIYITEKYLFPIALRNVAFIISRKGFDPNAEKASLGCLRENGKLIISINDDDLIRMLNSKEKGEEPSDYLLDKVEQLLMSVSK